MRSPAQIHEIKQDLPIVILGGGFGGLFTALHLKDIGNARERGGNMRSR